MPFGGGLGPSTLWTRISHNPIMINHHWVVSADLLGSYE